MLILVLRLISLFNRSRPLAVLRRRRCESDTTKTVSPSGIFFSTHAASQEASLLFYLVARRYEKASMILTSNKGFVDWGEVFADQVVATAILDRLLHHATTLNINGESFRLKEKRKAGLVTQPINPPERGN